MRTFRLNKLVRDKVLPDMEQLGQHIVYRRLNDEAYLKALVTKLVEEANEFSLDSEAESLKELADILEVVEALATELHADYETIRKIQLERREERGGFNDRIFIDTVSMPDTDPWAAYYAKEPNRFPEVTE